MRSAVAHGRVWHERLTPRHHRFDYAFSQIHLDLAEAPTLLKPFWLWSWDKPNLASIRRADHLRGGPADLTTAVRDEIELQTGDRPAGPVSLLTQPRYFGYCLNPISFYFIWSPDRSRIEWLLLEVHNTPWDEQHPYVLKMPEGDGLSGSVRFAKEMHVSPFMDMNMHYRLHLDLKPNESLKVQLENWRDDERLFGAGMSLQFQPVTRASLASLLVRTPLMSMKVAAAIYFEALRLKLKGVPYVPHPNRSPARKSVKPSGVV